MKIYGAKLKCFSVIKYAFMFIVSIAVIYPIFFVFILSFKTSDEIFLKPFSFPDKIRFSVYLEVLFKFKLAQNMMNSLYYAFTSVLLTLAVCLLAAYAISRMKWKLSKTFMSLLLTGILVPFHSMVIPLFITVSKLGINEPKVILVLLFTAFGIPTTIFILVSFLQDIPRSIEESAVIDGCSIWRLIRSIIIPLMKPAIATVCIFNFLNSWNDLLLSIIFINKDSDKTLQMGIQTFQGAYMSRYDYILSSVVIAVIPTIVIYIFLQSKIIEGITAGAVKG